VDTHAKRPIYSIHSNIPKEIAHHSIQQLSVQRKTGSPQRLEEFADIFYLIQFLPDKQAY